jgi:site-specific recombinase XerD
LKYRALFMSCYGAGLRINEACHLRVTDVDSKQMLIHVRHPKGGQERLTLLSAKLLEVLRAYWREHKSRLWLFPGTTPGQPVSREAARAALAKASLEAGLTKKCKPHTLRHCFATHLLDAGVELVVLQALLGHRSIRTTSCYTHVSVPHLQKVVSPLDRLPTISATAPAQRKVQG